MGSSLNKDEAEERNAASGEPEQALSAERRSFRQALDALAERRKRLGKQDVVGRTPLFKAAEAGDLERVKEIIFSFRGTGMFPPRLSLIAKEDVLGLTAADVAEQNGHEEIAQLLRSEQGRMEFFE